jgi:predicted DNA-binding protein
MAQVSVIVPEDIYALLSELVEETGRSTSSLCSHYIREGIYKEIDNLNKVGAWRDMVAKQKQCEHNSQKQK